MLQKPKLGEAKYYNMGSLKNITKNLKPRSVGGVCVGGDSHRMMNRGSGKEQRRTHYIQRVMRKWQTGGEHSCN